VDFSLGSTANTHKCKCFDVFATKSSSADHESFDLAKLLLNVATEDLYLIVVSAVSRSSVDFTFWNCFKNVVMQPLLQWTVLSCKFDDFLGNDSSKECCLGANGTG